MQDFIDDDAGYLAWVRAHPDGFVVNAPRSGGSVPLILHGARCTFISSVIRSNYTTTSYYKVCAEDREALLRWLQGRAGKWKTCPVCTPFGEGTALSSHAPIPQPTRPRTVVAARAQPLPQATSITASQAEQPWPLWKAGEITHRLSGLEPRLESWNAQTDPAQIQLQAYLAQVARDLGPLPEPATGLFLHLDVDVQRPIALLRHYDLENYLTPLVRHLGPQRFSFVSATKRVGGGSRLVLGVAEPLRTSPDDWLHFSCESAGAAGTRQWKTDLRETLAVANPVQLLPGPVAVQLAWRCTARRNWVQLWKPTGDAMGPVLGEPDSAHPFNPADDRIVSLQLHRCVDDTAGNRIGIGMWWRPWQGAEAE